MRKRVRGPGAWAGRSQEHSTQLQKWADYDTKVAQLHNLEESLRCALTPPCSPLLPPEVTARHIIASTIGGILTKELSSVLTCFSTSTVDHFKMRRIYHIMSLVSWPGWAGGGPSDRGEGAAALSRLSHGRCFFSRIYAFLRFAPLSVWFQPPSPLHPEEKGKKKRAQLESFTGFVPSTLCALLWRHLV